MYSRLGEILLEQGYLTVEQRTEALKEAAKNNMRLGEVLCSKGYITSADLAKCLALQYECDYVPEASLVVDATLLNLIEADFAKEHLVLPIISINSKPRVAIADPLDIKAMDYLVQRLKVMPEICIAERGVLMKAIQSAYQIDEPDKKLHAADEKNEALTKKCKPHDREALLELIDNDDGSYLRVAGWND